jgi:hypothetical protein
LVVPTHDSFLLEAAFLRLLQVPRGHWQSPDRTAWLEDHSRSALATRMLKVLSDVR